MSANLDDDPHTSDSEDDDFVPQDAGNESDEEDASSDEDNLAQEGEAADGQDTEGHKGVKRKQDTDNNDESIGKRSRTGVEDAATNESSNERKSRIDALWADFAGPASSKNGENGARAHRTLEKKAITITEQFEFAGEKIKVTKKIDSSISNLFPSTTATAEKTEKPTATTIPSQATSTEPPKAGEVMGGRNSQGLGVGTKRKGTSSMLSTLASSLGRPKKLNALEKSKLDWQGFVEKEGIEDELRYANKDGYLERMDFLGRVDARGEEAIRNLRKKK